MKVLFPKNIKKGLLAGLNFTIGPLTIGIVQLVLLALGAAAALGIFSAVAKTAGNVVGGVFAVIIFCIFLVIAFFNVSELGLLAFVGKKVKDLFFDTVKKYQVNYAKHNPIDIVLSKSKSEEKKQKIERKSSKYEKMEEMEKGGLLG